MRYLVTGTAGFIGSHIARRLLAQGDSVVGLDNLNDYYDPQLKRARMALLCPQKQFSFVKASLEDRPAIEQVFTDGQFDRVIHLAAQAGVRHSINNPYAYVDSNLVGFLNILEGCRHHKINHLVYASSSSVYGGNTQMPFSIHHNVDHPVSLYAATKKANELMAHVYAHLYEIPCTGLRFFTVYGPWGRPDMALSLFTKAILEDKPIDVFNEGKMKRDFTYIDDIVEGVIRVCNRPPQANSNWDKVHPDPGTSFAPARVFNIGHNEPVDLMRYISVLEQCLGKTAKKNFLPLQPGDVLDTCADIDDLEKEVGYRPSTPIETGIQQFVKWYLEYYKIAAS